MTLHWLPITFRIDFKTLLLLLKPFVTLATEYILRNASPVPSATQPQILRQTLLTLPTSNLGTKGN